MSELARVADELLVSGKGIMAIDASNETMEKRMAEAGIESSAETRRKFRELLVTTPGIEQYISGFILYDETIRQEINGNSFARVISEKGMLPGIKVDKGIVDLPGFPGEKITCGMDGLRQRLTEYKEVGAKFCKWRAVATVGKNMPSGSCVQANMLGMALYAGFCQEAGLLPIVEPEVLMDGDHTTIECERATEMVLKMLFSMTDDYKIALESLVLKTNMVLPGKDAVDKVRGDEVVERTVGVLKRSVPVDLAGVVFLSGGQEPTEATRRFNEVMRAGLPWPATFSFERALEGPAMKAWGGNHANREAAQKTLLHRAKMNSLAGLGKYLDEMENSKF